MRSRDLARPRLLSARSAQRAGERAAVGGAGVDVVLRLDRRRRPPRRPSPTSASSTALPFSAASACGEPLLPVADADHADMRVRGLAARRRRRTARRRPCAKSPRRRANSWKPQRRAAGHAGRCISVMISSGFERGRQRAQEEIGGLDGARAGLADDGDLRVAGQRDAGHLGGRIGMRDAAADGAAVADLVMRDVRRSRALSSGCAVASRLSSRMSRQRTMRAEPDAVGADLDLAQVLAACADRPAATAAPCETPSSASGSGRRPAPWPRRHGRRAAPRLR